MSFPVNPIDGAVYTTALGTAYVYNAAREVWLIDSHSGKGATGFTGDTGAQGVTGIYGITGVPGITGSQGLTGVSGITGIVGNTGVQGGTGVQGYTGIAGIAGTQGNTGVQGIAGSQGATGIDGTVGSQGSTGVAGIAGTQGSTGVGYTGIQGITGLGSYGTTGFQGETGSQGITGLGSYGTTGFQGQTGSQGITGLGSYGTTGFQGETGAQGATGAQGLTGIIGLAGDIGSTGTQGQTGAQGLTGLRGVTGVDGVTGLKGITGLQNATGIQGLTGAQGYTGAQGLTGAAGVTGLIGITGLQNATGIQGLTGAQGYTGAQGLTGGAGVTGLQNATGIQGQTGAQGFTGAQGYTGAQGTTTARTGYFGASFEAVVTISSAKVSANGTYTAFINLANLSSAWWNNCNAACNIVVTDSNNNKLKSYVENFNKAASTGIVWVKAALTTSSGGVVIVQTGSGVSNSNDLSTFTDCNVIMRYPLIGAEGNDTASGTVADAMTAIVYNASGVVSSGVTTTVANSLITFPNTITALNNPATLTVTGWWKKAASAHNNNVFFAWAGATPAFRMDDYSGDSYAYIQYTGAGTDYAKLFSSNIFGDNVWSHVAVTYDGALSGNTKLNIYANSVSKTAQFIYTGTMPATLGNLQTATTRQMARVDGSEAEFRVYSTALSNNYITTDYNLQNHNQSSVYTVVEYTVASAGSAGSQGLAGSSSGYTNAVYQATIQVPASNVFENGDYAVYIDLSKFNNTWWSNVTTLANIVFTDSANTKLKSFIEGFNAGSKVGYAWIKATLSTVSGGVIKAQVGSLINTSNLAATFTDLNMCARLSLDGADASSITDSTGNGYYYGSVGSWTYLQSYAIPNGIRCAPVAYSDGYSIDLGNVTQLNSASNFTITMWEKTTSPAWTYGALWGKDWGNGKLSCVNTGTQLDYRILNSTQGDVYTNGNDIIDGTWHNLAFTFDGTQSLTNYRMNVYNNGALASALTKYGTAPATTQALTERVSIGTDNINGYYPTPGSYDEFRIYSTTKSGNWLKTDYLLQNNNISAAYTIIDQSAPISIGLTGIQGYTGVNGATGLMGVTGANVLFSGIQKKTVSVTGSNGEYPLTFVSEGLNNYGDTGYQISLTPVGTNAPNCWATVNTPKATTGFTIALMTASGYGSAKYNASTGSDYPGAQYRSIVQVSAAKVLENGNYAVCINLSQFSAAWWSYVSTLANIVFTDTSNNKLNSFVESVNPLTRTGTAWVYTALTTSAGGTIKAQVGTFLANTNSTSTFTNLGIVARYGMEEASGTIYDSTGNYNATVTGNATYASPGVNGKSLYFGPLYYGAGSANLNCGDITQMNSASKVMITGLFNSSQVTYLQMWVFTKASQLYYAQWSGPNNGYIDGANGFVGTGLGSFTPGSWNHVAFVFDGTQSGNANRLRFLIDGTSKIDSYSGTIPATTTNMAGSPFYIGTPNTGANSYIGYIEEIRVYAGSSYSDNWVITDKNLQKHNLSAAYTITEQSSIAGGNVSVDAIMIHA